MPLFTSGGLCLGLGRVILVFVLRIWNAYITACRAAATICPRPSKWWLERPHSDIMTLTFDLWSHCARRWCGSSCSIPVPHLKFVSLPVPRIWLIFGHGVKRPVDLDLLTLGVIRNVSCSIDNLSANFGISATFRCRLMGKHAADWRHDLITLTFDLCRHRACRWCGSSYSIPVPRLKIVGLPLGKYGAFFVSTLIDLWPFDLYMRSPVTRDMGFLLANFQLAMPFYFRFRVRHARDRQSDDRRPSTFCSPTQWRINHGAPHLRQGP